MRDAACKLSTLLYLYTYKSQLVTCQWLDGVLLRLVSMVSSPAYLCTDVTMPPYLGNISAPLL